MSSYTPRVFREYSTHQFFAMTPPKKRRLLLTRVSGDCFFQVQSDVFNLVLNRDLRVNTKLACEAAVHLALRYPDQKVLLLNTYAGFELMHEGFAEAMDANELSYGTVIPNLTVLDVPLTQWKPELLEEQIVQKEHSIVIWNSFEFAAITRYQREKIASEAMVLQDAHPVTHVIFSHEAGRKQKAGQPGRGALGMLAAAAGSLWTLGGPPEEEEHHRLWYDAIFKGNNGQPGWAMSEDQREAMQTVDLETVAMQEPEAAATESTEDQMMQRLGEKAKEILGGQDGVQVIQGASLLLQLLMRDIHEKEMQKRQRVRSAKF
jgi:hypothetical protein